MQLAKYNSSLRSVLVSKLNCSNQAAIPVISRLSVRAKSEFKSDTIMNALLVNSLASGSQAVPVTGAKKADVVTEISLKSLEYANFISRLLPLFLSRVADKVVSSNFGSRTNHLQVTLPASDFVGPAMRSLCKLLEVEISLYRIELTFVTNSFAAHVNETLLRSYQLPIVLKVTGNNK